MEETHNSKENPFSFLESMMAQASSFWEPLTKTESSSDASSPLGFWQESLKTWQAFQEGQGTNGSSPNAWTEMARSGWETMAKMASTSNGEAPFWSMGAGAENSREIMQRLMGFVAEEMGRFASLPALGLLRNYHEKAAEVTEKCNHFVLTLTEYLFLMFTPFEGAARMVQESIKASTSGEGQRWDSDAVYNLWLKELERAFFTLYSSEKYLQALRRVVEAMGEYNLARQAVLSDCLRAMGVPSERDLDDLYKDLYDIKKRIASLEKAKSNRGRKKT